MKHPDRNIETFEFNLGQAPRLRCVHSQKTTICGSCEACVLAGKLDNVKSWFLRAGDQSRRRYTLGLIRRLHSVDLIQYVINLLQPLLCKDFTYARMRTKPSLTTDQATMSCDRALSPIELEKNIADSWYWFQVANYWTKSNFLLGILQCCDAHLMHAIGTHARTLLASEQRAFIEKDNYEEESVASSTYTYNSTERPEHELLSTTCSVYSPIANHPFGDNKTTSRPMSTRTVSRASTLKVDPNYEVEIYNDDSGDESLEGTERSVDPTCMVIPGSAKAFAGVAKYKDFVRCLPVHLSKYILGYLDQVSLFNCVCVSRHWRMVTEEVHKEYYVNQQVREEVMLMQGASAHGCNPVYANDIDVIVPNIALDSSEAIKTGDNVIETTFKSEVSFRTAYSGYSTRKIIMEERNVYCGAYNVMVLSDLPDGSRVVDTNGGQLIGVGSQDRKIRFIKTETAQEETLVCTGHAGSIRCVALREEDGYVLSGSYDTSIRKWSLETGKCQKIFRGHRDTILCMKICNDKIVSGAKDHMCKVWLRDTGKCIRTFKHRQPITAVAMGEDPLPEIVVSGCEAGRVKVWNLNTGELIKRLSGHHAPVTDIKFDRWHIMTGSRDGYALAWSALGDHARCLTALRHPTEVLCLEFMYLRVITGSADGKLRIWNMVTAECLRIMRGNSRSDPISQLIAIDNIVTINTTNNLLVLNFEPVEYDYTLEDDKMPPLVQYSKYSDAPIRNQPYPYIRAQRMKTAGATNPKIIGQQRPITAQRLARQMDQTPHSAKSLSRTRMTQAKRIQSAAARLDNRGDTGARDARTASSKVKTSASAVDVSSAKKVASAKSVSIGRPPSSPMKTGTAKSRPVSTKSGSHSMVSGVGFQLGKGDDDSEEMSENPADMRRRVSWAFNNPIIPKAKELSLSETKSLLKSQMRAEGEVVPPDFVYLAVNSIHSNMRPTEASKNMEANVREKELALSRRLGRPSSSPSRIDPRTKIPIEDMDLDQLIMEHGLAPRDIDMRSEAESKLSTGTSSKGRLSTGSIPGPTTTIIIKEFAAKPVDATPNLSLHSDRVKSSIPRPVVLRPHTATVIRVPNSGKTAALAEVRPKSAAGVVLQRPGTAQTTTSTIRSQSATDIGDRSPSRKGGITSCGAATKPVPMMMYSKDLKERLEVLKEHRAIKQADAYQAMMACRVGNVSQFNNPMRTNADFRLLTHEQTKDYHKQVAEIYSNTDKVKKEDLERRQRQAWLAKVKGRTDINFAIRPKSVAPEIREYAEIRY